MKLKTVKLLLTFFFLWVTTQFGIDIENLLAYIFVLSLGILHGSNDLKLIGNFSGEKKYTFRTKLSIYIFVVLFSFCFFLIFPSIGLLLFILFSGYHFGEQHLAEKIKSKHWSKYFLYLIYGLLIFFLVFHTHSYEVINIIYDITNINLNASFFSYFLFITFGSLIIFYLVYSDNKNSLIQLIEEVAYVFLFYVLFTNSTLLWSFAIYFIVWHALPSLNDQIITIYGKISLANVVKYLKVSFLYWGFSVIGICMLSYFTADNTSLFNLLFVALLASITFPHAFVIFKMQR
ncbi:MAG: hypothetical protein EVA43_05390 [Flavobacteriales bacterium]|nr:MAG: hypothetical protein EVA43_05390 [Flavobacteriales bacterium]